MAGPFEGVIRFRKPLTFGASGPFVLMLLRHEVLFFILFLGLVAKSRATAFTLGRRREVGFEFGWERWFLMGWKGGYRC